MTAAALAACSTQGPAGHETTSGAIAPTSAPTSTSTTGSSFPTRTSTWLSYHASGSRQAAVAYGVPRRSPHKTWSADLGGAVRGQALVFGGHVLAATEKNRVVALDPSTGRVVWSRTLGRPLTDVAGRSGCGNIDPLGITSTPVIDAATGTIYVVAEIDDGNGSVHHQLFGLDAASGAVRVDVRADPPLSGGQQAIHLLQRAGLAFSGGRVIVSYGGNSGDCGNYHGWVVSIDAQHPGDPTSFEVASDGEGGAIWQSGGAPAVDAGGNIFVTSGNANPDPPQGGPDPKKYTESVIKLDAALKPLASYKDVVAGGDEDLSTANPVLLPGGLVFAVGKTDIGFLLRASDLTLVAKVAHICGSDPDGGPAYDARTQKLFVPCRGGGIQVVDIAQRSRGRLLSGADSSPVVLAGTVWALNSDEGKVVGYDPSTGVRVGTADVGADLPVFESPSALPGMMLVPTATGVTAFD
ncbi:PQQ-binding-like beta-propeller repeat protein [Allobranchiibius sp. GilTou38]|uniref:outer membrane protein assembly factor BamB family protein n=1 Tax=Allobranchiibius sp. GilTou38 TaxID=2815210 RepID=UPI001AA14C31|nr:PQQ-binding-like beta-propeller repeat protein [Allobranchiibius sp. GilTou38]MBO1768424.1 PQQ-binding-like beta-propeller repeat protein [Allobranchiibius sp. GilTou38]